MAKVVFDDGTGPALYVAGLFTTVGGVAANYIARWDGDVWSPLGSGLDEEALALAVYDDGSGPALFVGGRFTTAGGVPANRIAKWDGSAWSPVGLGLSGYVQPVVYSLTAFDNGGSAVLVAGGRFASAGFVAASCVAQWDGVAWSALGGGLNPDVRVLAVNDDGSGERLYAGGDFTGGGGTTLARIAQWDGTAWSALGTGTNGIVRSLTSFDDGSGGGPALYAGGEFTTAGGASANRVAKWNGTSWSPLAAGLSGAASVHVSALVVFDDGLGGGSTLIATGRFTNSGGSPLVNIARWDGATWSALGPGVQGSFGLSLAVFDDGGGSGAALYASGALTVAGSTWIRNIARWDGAVWSRLGDATGTSDWTYAVAEFDDGSGPALYAGGKFHLAGDGAATRVARWDGNAWSPLGSGVDNEAYALTTFDDGSGTALYAGGKFRQAGGTFKPGIAKWDGSSWSALGTGLQDSLSSDTRALHVFDDGGGPALYAGGGFTSAGEVSASRVARWNGTSWSALGAGLNDIVEALVSFDDGSGGGSALYAGGSFGASGGAPVSYIAKWNGASWQPVGGGVDGRVLALAVYDDGTGAALYAGGYFAHAGGVQAPLIARWDGSTWSSLPGGPNALVGSSVRTLAVFDPGTGSQLFVGGDFQSLAGSPVGNIARWDGTSWHTMEEGVNDWVLGMVVAAVGPGGPALYVAGRFAVSPARDSHVAKWGCTTSPVLGDTYCFGDGSGTPCPCSNAGGPSEGCANSTGSGATLAGSGSASVAAADLVLSGSNLVPGQPGLYFQANTRINGGLGNPFGDGLRCAGGAVQRLQVRTASGSGSSNTTVDIVAQGGVLPGSTHTYQLWYRDPVSSPCGTGFNLTNGLSVAWTL